MYLLACTIAAERANESDSVTNEDSSDNQISSNLNANYATTPVGSGTSNVAGSINAMQAFKNASNQKERLDQTENASAIAHHGQTGVGHDAMKDFKSKLAANAGSSYISAKKSGQLNKKTRYR